MRRTDGTRGTLGRRKLLVGGALATGGLLAGCVGGGGTTSDPTSEAGETTSVEGTNGAAEPTSGTTEGGPYTVSMAPMGDVEFDAVPESVFTVFS